MFANDLEKFQIFKEEEKEKVKLTYFNFIDINKCKLF